MSKKENKRALRRHHTDRHLARTLRIIRHWHGREPDEDAIYRTARRLRDNLKFCRCMACRNPRLDGLPPVQERRANEAHRRDTREP